MYHSENDNTKEERSNEGNEVKRESEPKDQIKASDTNEEDVVFKEKHQVKNGKNPLQKIFKRADELSQKMKLDKGINEKIKELLIKVEEEKQVNGTLKKMNLSGVFGSQAERILLFTAGAVAHNP